VIVYWLKVSLMYVYALPACTAALLISLARWGHPSNNRIAANIFAWGPLKLWGVRLEIEDEHLLHAHQPCIYTSNHQGAMDVPIFGWIFPRNAVVVGKKELLWIPIFNLFFLAAGNLALNRQARSRAIAHLGEAAAEVKRRGVSVWIFPEGTRNRTDDPLLPFKKGAFYMAIQAKVPIVPVVAEPIRRYFDHRTRTIRGGVIRVKVLPAIDTSRYSEDQVGQLSNEVRAKMLEAFLSFERVR
jgi:1-acyl-sn-glycerol-3-phosphate acyltransferase